MSTNQAIRLRAAGSTYGVIHRLGLKYMPPALARPSWAAGAVIAKELWNKMFDIFDNYRRQAVSDEAEARRQIISLVENYGPRIWGDNRANVVSFPSPQYPEYTRDLHWKDGLEVQQLYCSQS
jgi:hypothetical protein